MASIKPQPPVFSRESLEETAPEPPVVPLPEPTILPRQYTPPQIVEMPPLQESGQGEDRPSIPVVLSSTVEEPKKESLNTEPPAPKSAPPKFDMMAIQNHLKKVLTGKPAVAAYLQQARTWSWEEKTLVVWFDNKVAFNIVLPELESLRSSLKGLATPPENLEIREWEEIPETETNLDDFDRQVELIAQVFRGERLPDKPAGEKK